MEVTVQNQQNIQMIPLRRFLFLINSNKVKHLSHSRGILWSEDQLYGSLMGSLRVCHGSEIYSVYFVLILDLTFWYCDCKGECSPNLNYLSVPNLPSLLPSKIVPVTDHSLSYQGSWPQLRKYTILTLRSHR